MSRFLLNLARRGAGIAPVLRARTMPAADVPAVAGDPVPAEPVRPTAAAIASTAEPARVQGATAQTSSVAPTLVVQRLVSSLPIAPAAPVASPVVQPQALRPAPAVAAPLTSVGAPPRSHDVESAVLVVAGPAVAGPAVPGPAVAGPVFTGPVAAAFSAADPAAVQLPATPPATEAWHVEPIAAPGKPATSLSIAPRVDVDSIDPAERPSPWHERVISHRELTRVVEPRLIEAPLPAFEREPSIAILPAAPRHPVVKEPPPEERVVHVRIGSIEIHAASSAAPAAPVPAAPAMRPAAQPPFGFDDFARLRRYTSWDW